MDAVADQDLPERGDLLDTVEPERLQELILQNPNLGMVNFGMKPYSAAAPIWIARTVLPGATLAGDSFSMQVRGDVDAV